MPGWTARLDRDQAAGTTRSVTWTAAPGTGIGADQFALFRISVTLPAGAKTVSFPATQTYSDGTVVKWDQATPPGGAEPENPVPELALTGAKADADGDHPMPIGPGVGACHRRQLGAVVGGRRVGARRRCGRHGAGGTPAIMNRLVATAALVVGFVIAALAGAGVASAHAVRVATDPVENTALAQAPQQVSAMFNEKLQPSSRR